jgi:hypothetical protein
MADTNTNTNNEEKRPRFTSASNSKLPLASKIPDRDIFNRAVILLKRNTELKAKISEAEEELGSNKEELSAVCEAFNLKGIKYGLDGFSYEGYITRQTLSKERLLALGVPAETIAEAYVEGHPFLSTKVLRFDME